MAHPQSRHNIVTIDGICLILHWLASHLKVIVNRELQPLPNLPDELRLEPECPDYCAGGVCKIPTAQSTAIKMIKAVKAPPVQYAVFLVSGVIVGPSI